MNTAENPKPEKICSFFGHRDVDITDELYTRTKAEIIKAIGQGCRVFYFGGYGSFDDLCYRIVTEIKEEQADLNIRRIYCVSQERFCRKKVRYFQREDYDEVIYLTPSFEGWYKSIYFRNCAMIDGSDMWFFMPKQEKKAVHIRLTNTRKRKKGSALSIFGGSVRI